MSEQNFITGALDKIAACKLAMAIREVPLKERERYKAELPTAWLHFVGIYTFDLTKEDLKKEIVRLEELLVNKCDDVELNELKKLLK